MSDYNRFHGALDYDAESGLFRWKQGQFFAGKLAGHKKKDGYVYIGFQGRGYLAHRIAWLLTSGNWPAEQIDHIDRNGSNNSLANLREATGAENGFNRPAPNRTSGVRGVTWHKQVGRWQAQICKDGKRIYLGLYDSIEDARGAYLSAATKMKVEAFLPRATS